MKAIEVLEAEYKTARIKMFEARLSHIFGRIEVEAWWEANYDYNEKYEALKKAKISEV